MGWGELVKLAADVWLKLLEYELKISAVFQDILSITAFGNFILQQSEDLDTRKQWMEWYDKAIKAYGYYILLPCIAKVYGEDIEKSPHLRAYFHNWDDYYKIWLRIQREPEANGEDLEGIAKAFRDFFSPIVKGYMQFTGTISAFLRDLLNSASYALWDIAKRRNFDMVYLINTVIQRYRGIGDRMRTANVPKEFYYQQRPTLDLDIATLLAHVQAYTAYKTLLEADVEAEEQSPLHKDLIAEIYIDGKLYTTVKMQDASKIKFCLPKELIEQMKGKPLDLELGGVGSGEE